MTYIDSVHTSGTQRLGFKWRPCHIALGSSPSCSNPQPHAPENASEAPTFIKFLQKLEIMVLGGHSSSYGCVTDPANLGA